MPATTNSFSTFSAVGNREDVADTIYNISPIDAPFLGSIDSSTANAVLHEWQTDQLAPAAANAVVEGDDSVVSGYNFKAVIPTTRMGNICQISRKDVVVSGTQDVVQKAGRQSEMVYQMVKRAREIKRDMEFILTGNQASNAGNASTARQLRSLCAWYQTNVNRAGGGANGTASAAATDAATTRALTEAMLKTTLQQCWVAGGSPDLIMSGPYNKTVISGFTGGTTKTQNITDGTLSTAIDVYASDFGFHKIVANRFSRDRDLHLLDTSMWMVAYLRPLQTIDLAKTGDNLKGQILAEYTLESRNEAASGIIADLAISG
ncbi:MAG: DUF5309 domain-containing protein [Candidatus Symbiobacter sp.]|nr:DUF5309 domain-containing protein [Candidatus Symbiobacter sp.]